jgi:hypothetical protein
LSDHAAALAKVLDHFEGVRAIHLVAHSMGNMVVRSYLAAARTEGIENERIGRIVMLGPPNNGAQLAERFRENKLFQTLLGAGALELAQSAEVIEKQLGTPSVEFGIVAGGTGTDAGHSPLLEGDDDFVVSVAETRLPGAADFIVVPTLHTTIMDHAAVREYTLRFLRDGYFLSPEKRCPIPGP